MRRNPVRPRASAVIASAAAVAAAVVLPLDTPAPAAVQAYPVPTVMAALGDSITQAYNDCPKAWTNCPAVSWSAGSQPASHAARLRDLAGSPVTAYDDAVTGSVVSGLGAQVTTAARQKPGYVTILSGDNDSCRPTEATMTSVASFTTSAKSALAAVLGKLPASLVLVVGQPDPLKLLAAGAGDDTTVATWSRLKICPSALANPRSTAPEDVARRARVRDRVLAYNAAWRSLCAASSRCRYSDAVFAFQPTLADLSPVDGFHPSAGGQSALAALTWNDQSAWFAPAPPTPPVATPTLIPTPSPTPSSSDGGLPGGTATPSPSASSSAPVPAESPSPPGGTQADPTGQGQTAPAPTDGPSSGPSAVAAPSPSDSLMTGAS